MITPPYPKEEASDFAIARATLENFAINGRISLRWNPKDDVPAMMARTCPLNRYVFDFRTKGDEGGIRIFGRFAATNCFVALTYHFREGLVWKTEVNRCCDEWISLFGATPCFQGNSPNDYISSNLRVAEPRRRRARS
jgi:hypothetical protein